jgi:dihydroorotate dehydrogenase electron transfer subunit
VRSLAASVLENEPLGADVFVMRLRAPEGARDCRPGQFLHVRCTPPGGHDPLLGRAFWVMRADDESLWLRYRVVGPGTRFLSRLRAGDELKALGPLGQAFQLPAGARHLLLVGRDLDVAPLVMLADLALAREIEVALVAGFDEAASVLPADLVGAAAEYRVATADGSLGHHGAVAELAGELMPWADALFVAGPVDGLSAIVRGTSKPVQVALGGWRGCATGVCLECVVHTWRGNKRACRDGPVFEWSELR